MAMQPGWYPDFTKPGWESYWDGSAYSESREVQPAAPVAPTRSVGGPPAGWYDDPSGSGRQRYWDGSEWTEHLQPTSTAASLSAGHATVPPRSRGVRQTSLLDNPWSTSEDRKNPQANLALTFGILALFASLLTGIPALVLGIIGVHKAGSVGVGRGKAIWGIALGALFTIISVIWIGAGISSASHPKVDAADFEKKIAAGIKDQSGLKVTVSCPGDQDFAKASTFICIATDSTGANHEVDVTIQNDQGEFIWKLQP